MTSLRIGSRVWRGLSRACVASTHSLLSSINATTTTTTRVILPTTTTLARTMMTQYVRSLHTTSVARGLNDQRAHLYPMNFPKNHSARQAAVAKASAEAALQQKLSLGWDPAKPHSNMVMTAPPVIVNHKIDGLPDVDWTPPAGVREDHPLIFAVVDFNAQQHRVVPGDLVMVDSMAQYEIGERIEFNDVMLIGSRDYSVIGRPVVPNTTVTAIVEEHNQTAKVLTFKKRRRKANSARLRGFRAQVTLLRIVDIDFDFDSLPGDAVVADQPVDSEDVSRLHTAAFEEDELVDDDTDYVNALESGEFDADNETMAAEEDDILDDLEAEVEAEAEAQTEPSTKKE
jgi:ribosomal protein L21